MSTAAEAGRKLPNDYLLYHQTIIPTQGVTHAIEGSFTLPNTHELVLVRHERLELWTLHPSAGGAECVHSMPLLCPVQAIVAVPTSSAGTSFATRSGGGGAGSGPSSSLGLDAAAAAAVRRDATHYIALTTHLGYLTLLRYALHEPPIPTHDSRGTAPSAQRGDGVTRMLVTSLRGAFVKVSEQCLGRSGARLTVPGARLAVDARGEALFVSALMRHKLVIPLVRTGLDAQALWQDSSRTLRDSAGGHLREDDDEDDADEADKDDMVDSDEERESGGLLASGSRTRGAGQSKSFKRRLLRTLHQPRGVVQLGSPLEISRQTIVYGVCALEGFVDGCRFAALEEEVVEASSPAQAGTGAAAAAAGTGEAYLKSSPSAATAPSTRRKMLVVYAYNASVHQVQRTDLIYVPHTAHRLIGVPAEPSGPGGVLVCTDTDLVWYDLSMRQVERQQQLRQQQNLQRRSTDTQATAAMRAATGVFKCSVPLPRRVDFVQSPYDPCIIQHALTRLPGGFFMLMQDELGDLFRVVLTTSRVLQAYDELRARQLTETQRRTAGALPPALAALVGGVLPTPSTAVVNPLEVHYFDTLPACRALALFRNGYVFAGVESGPLHGLYRITRDGYKKESDYIVRHVRWVQPGTAPAIAAASTVKVEGPVSSSLASVGVKRERVAEDEEEEGPSPRGAAGMLPPAPRVTPSSAPPMPPSSSHSPSSPYDNAHALPSSAPRTIALFKPHPHCRHMTCMQSYPNTPAILSFEATIPDQTRDVDDSTGEATIGTAALALWPQQVEFRAVAGRGGDSTYVHAQYGCATRLESVKVLPSDAFYALYPLVSASALRQVVGDQARLLAATTETDRELALAISTASSSTSSASSAGALRRQLHALRRLGVDLAERCRSVGMDKLLLASAQATAAYTLGSRVELDAQVGFVTDARTLAAATLDAGRGYVQVTHKGVHLIPAPAPSGAMGGSVHAVQWTHPHGKAISAAAVNPFTFVVAFEGGGGLAAFALNETGTALHQLGVLPSFPATTALAVVQVPLAALTTRASTRASTGTAGAAARHDLVAVATARQQVFLFSARQLTEPLERLTCAGNGQAEHAADDAEREARGQTNDPIVSVLVTPLSSESQGASGRVEAGGDATTALRTDEATRLFCVVGHASGAVTLCELDTYTAKCLHTTALVCGRQPCQVLVGDAETYCYMRSGSLAWRCALVDGVPKVMPWRFATSQRTFAAYAMPRAGPENNNNNNNNNSGGRADQSSNAQESVQEAIARIRGDASGAQVVPAAAQAADGEADDDKEDDASVRRQRTEFVLASRAGAGSRTEAVLALHGRQLSLFVAAQPASVSASSLDFSFDAYTLPLAGRRLLAHPTRRDVHVVVNTEHRGHAMSQVAAYRRAKNDTSGEASALRSGIAPNAPGRSPGKLNEYASSVQLVDGTTHQLSAPYYLQDGEAALGAVMGAFADLGREPILVLATADHYTHGAGCDGQRTCGRGWLRAFYFKRVPLTTGVEALADGAPASARLTLRLDPLHNTLLRADEDGQSEDGAGTTASASARTIGGMIPSAIHLCEAVGLLMVGMASASAGLRLYVFGKRQFLRRRHLGHFPSPICAIATTFVTPATASNNNNDNNNNNNNNKNASAAASTGPFYANDLYQCPVDRPDLVRTASEKQLLIVCATQCASVIVVSVQARQGHATPSFLLRVARDRVLRQLTSLAMLDERTMAVSDRFGHVTFLRIPTSTRFGFAEPIASLYETELEECETYIAEAQHLEEVASHRTGQVVTCLQSVSFAVPGTSSGPPRTMRTLFYATTLGSIGAFTPVQTEEDGALAAYAWPLMGAHARPLMQPSLLNGSVAGALPHPQQASFSTVASAVPGHHVVDGDVFGFFKDATPAVFRPQDKESVEDELASKLRVERAQRERVLGLPPRTLPTVEELVATQRALATLPP